MGLVAELRRRNVFRVAIAYLIVAWLVLQVGDTLAPALQLGDWVNTLLAFFLILGFPMALFFAWAFELTPDGIKMEKDVDRSESVARQTGKKVDRLIIGVLVVAVVFFAFDKFVLDPSRDAERTEKAAAAAVEEQAIELNSIAVLPFADLSPEGDQEYFSDGIAEEILNVLVRADDLSVASRTSSFGFRGQEALGIPTIAQKLRVRHVLEGSVRKAGDTVRITAQLIDAETDQHLWSETYDRQLTAESIFEIQDEIARAIVDELDIFMDDTTSTTDTSNLDAYEQYLRAHKMFIERSDILGAVQAFEQAVTVDPGFARAHASLAAAYVIAPSWGYVGRDYFELAKMAAGRAIELDGNLALSHAVLGYVANGQEPPALQQALASYDHALELNPNETTVWLWRGLFNTSLGYFERARRDLSRCLELDPAYENCRRHLSRAELYSGNEERALVLIEERMLNGKGPGWPIVYLHAYRGDHSLVLANLVRVYGERHEEPLIRYVYRALMDPNFDFESERQEIETVYKAVTGDELDWGREELFNPVTFGVYDTLQPVMEWPVWWMPYPIKLAESSYPKHMIRALGFPDYWREHGFPPQCRAVGEDDFECDRPRATANERKRVRAPL